MVAFFLFYGILRKRRYKMNHKADVEDWATALVLKRMRYETGLKQYMLADELKMNRQRYSKLENARLKLSQLDREKILAYYQMESEVLHERINREIRILKGEAKDHYTVEKINYVKIRDERFHNH